jgi:hypothetical protein
MNGENILSTLRSCDSSAKIPLDGCAVVGGWAHRPPIVKTSCDIHRVHFTSGN